MTTPAERNLAAAVRAEEEGHRAFLRDGKIQVVSDTDDAIVYHVGAFGAVDTPATFHCTPHRRDGRGDATERNHGHTSSPRGGILPCKHCACAAKRLEREGLIRYEEASGLWLVAESAGKVDDADVFSSFPAH